MGASLSSPKITSSFIQNFRLTQSLFFTFSLSTTITLFNTINMKFTLATSVLALAAGVSAWSNDTIVYTTEVVDTYTTYCPYATSFTLGTKTYTVTEATTLTILDCSCTVSKPIATKPVTLSHSVKPYTSCPPSVPATKTATATKTASPAPPYKTITHSASVHTVAPSVVVFHSSGAIRPTYVPVVGAASANKVAGLAVAAVAGAAALVL